jgi:flagellar hook-associated protein 2
MSSINVISSGLDVQSIVDQLIEVERAPINNLQKQATTLQSKIKALQSFNTKLSTLLDKLNSALFKDETATLSVPPGFAQRLARSVFVARKTSSSDESAVAISADKGAPLGTYAVTVSSLARARTEASASFADTNSTKTGTGTLAIQVGTADPVTITIGDTNSTLEGIRDSINGANAGVNATIINDGSSSPYRLLITAEDTGTTNAFTITESLSGGQALDLVETQAAVDAQFTVNGIGISKSSNIVSDVISGVTFTLRGTTAAPVELTVERDTEAVVSALKELITAYNEVNTYANSQSRYNQDTKTAGILAGDTTLRNSLSKITALLTRQITNSHTSLHYIGEAGLNFNSDGSLSLDESKLRNALAKDVTGVAALFLGDGNADTQGSVVSSDPRVTYSSKTSATQPGAYAVEITSLAQRASVVGSQVVATLAQDETLTITYGGGQTGVVLLAGDSFTTVLSKINAALAASGWSATASDDGTGRVAITTEGYGSSESITVLSDVDGAPGATGFGTTPMTSTGTDITGTINGNAALGSGLTLAGEAGSPVEGLTLTIAQSTTGSYGTVTVTGGSTAEEGDGTLMSLRSMLKSLTDPLSGPIHGATDAFNNTIKGMQDRISEYEERLVVRKERLTAEFSRADQALKMLTVLQNQLSSQISSLSSFGSSQ